jgi:O-antigen/teichoic acid export membrane protein
MALVSETTAPIAALASSHGRFAAYGALAVRLGAAGLAYMLQIVLARSLGAAEYGTFSFAWSLVTIGGFLATFGYGQTAVRFLAQYQQADDRAHAHGFIRQSLLVTGLGSLVAIGGLLLVFPVVEWGWGSLCCAALSIGLFALPFFALTDLVEGYARSQGWTIRALLPPYILRGGGLVALLLLAMLVGYSLNAVLAMKLALIATALACLAQIALTVPALLRALPPAPPRYATADWIANARPTLLSDLALLARQNVDLIILGLVATPAAVGVYFAATRLSSLLGIVDFAIGAAFGHRFARGEASGSGGKEFAEARRMMLVLGLGGALALACATPLILHLFGPDFAGALIPAVILIAGAAIRMVFGPMDDLLSMAGFPQDALFANLVGAIVTAITCLLLAPALQATGAALGASLGGLASTLLLVMACRRRRSAGEIAR